jgi:glutamyl-tRNA synthetase
VASYLEAQLKEHGISAEHGYVVKVAGMMKERITFPSELWETCCYFFQAPTEYNEKDVAKRWTPDMHIHMQKVIDILNTVPFEHDAIHKALLDDYIAANGLNTGKVMNSLRIAVVGRTVGPDMITLVLTIGKEETIRRVERAIEKIKIEK